MSRRRFLGKKMSILLSLPVTLELFGIGREKQKTKNIVGLSIRFLMTILTTKYIVIFFKKMLLIRKVLLCLLLDMVNPQ